ncbi:uncharacterized [Tachysurus ichikawai]
MRSPVSEGEPVKCQGQGGAERAVERSEWGLERRLVNGRQEWNGGCKQQKMERERMKKEQKRRGRWLRDLPAVLSTIPPAQCSCPA